MLADSALMEKQRITGAHRILFLICFLGDALGGTVSTLVSNYLPEVVRDLHLAADNAAQVRIGAYINAIFIFGWTLGGFIWGLFSDRSGRKQALVLAIVCYGLFTLLTAAMQNWWSIVACRFMSGFGVGGVLVISITMLSESWPANSRAIFIGILSIAFPVGIFSAGLLTFNIPFWRTAFVIAGILPLITALAAFWLITESNEWLSNRENKTKPTDKWSSLFSSDNRKHLITGSLIFGSMLIGLWAIFSWLPSWVQSLITNGDGQKERGLSMMLMGMGGLVGGFCSGWFLNAIGLRKSMLLCFSISAILSFILFKTNSVFSPLIYIEIAVMAFSFGISQGILSYYIPNLFSTGIRSASTGFCFNTGRLLTGIAVFFVGILVTTLGGYGNAIFIFSLVFVIGLITIFLNRNIE